MQAQLASAEELRRLVAALERSGLAERRADVAELLAHSRARLAHPRPLRRARTGARARSRALLAALLDAAAVLALVTGGAGLLAGTLSAPLAGAWLAAGLAWGGRRAGRRLLRAAGEGARRAHWWGRRAAAWTAEPFSDAAFARLEAMDDALDLMRAWRRHAHPAPDLAAVAAFLAARHGPLAGRRFQALAEARLEAAGRRSLGGAPAPEARLLRWSGLIGLFEALAEEDALWAAAPPLAPAPLLRAVEPLADAPERRQRRMELSELIRRKRQEVTTAHGWKLKTAAEMAQRDMHLKGLRAEIARLEAELSAPEPAAADKAPADSPGRGA